MGLHGPDQPYSQYQDYRNECYDDPIFIFHFLLRDKFMQFKLKIRAKDITSWSRLLDPSYHRHYKYNSALYLRYNLVAHPHIFDRFEDLFRFHGK